MASGLEAKDAQMESMQQEHSNVQTQLLLCQERVSQLQAELLQVCAAHLHLQRPWSAAATALNCDICDAAVLFMLVTLGIVTW